MSVYSFVRVAGGFLMRVFFPLKIYGAENITNEGNTVVICNHLSAMDVPTVGLVYKDKTYFLAKKEWYKNKLVVWFFNKMGGIPVDRDNTDLQSAKACLTVLKKNGRLCIFPEGTRNKNGTELQPFHAGAGLFAFRSKSQIQPIILLKKPKIFRKTRVYVGKVFVFSEYYDKKGDSALNELLLEKMQLEMKNAQNFLRETVQAEKNKKAKKSKKSKKSETPNNDAELN